MEIPGAFCRPRSYFLTIMLLSVIVTTFIVTRNKLSPQTHYVPGGQSVGKSWVICFKTINPEMSYSSCISTAAVLCAKPRHFYHSLPCANFSVWIDIIGICECDKPTNPTLKHFQKIFCLIDEIDENTSVSSASLGFAYTLWLFVFVTIFLSMYFCIVLYNADVFSTK